MYEFDKRARDDASEAVQKLLKEVDGMHGVSEIVKLDQGAAVKAAVVAEVRLSKIKAPVVSGGGLRNTADKGVSELAKLLGGGDVTVGRPIVKRQFPHLVELAGGFLAPSED